MIRKQKQLQTKTLYFSSSVKIQREKQHSDQKLMFNKLINRSVCEPERSAWAGDPSLLHWPQTSSNTTVTVATLFLRSFIKPYNLPQVPLPPPPQHLECSPGPLESLSWRPEGLLILTDYTKMVLKDHWSVLKESCRHTERRLSIQTTRTSSGIITAFSRMLPGTLEPSAGTSSPLLELPLPNILKRTLRTSSRTPGTSSVSSGTQ